MKKRFQEWYDGWPVLLVKCVLWPGLLLCLAATGIGILMLPVLFWLGKDSILD